MNIARYEIKDQVIYEIGRFSILWNEFERRYTNYGRNSLGRCANELMRNKTAYLEFFSTLRWYLLEQKSFCGIESTQDFVEYFLFTEYAKRNPDLQSKEEINRQRKIRSICFFLDNTNTEKETVLGCLYIIHRYRDNLMHGLKNLDGLNNQYTVFKSFNEFLESLLK